MIIKCAWCNKTIQDGDLPVSHGICKECKAAIINAAAVKPQVTMEDLADMIENLGNEIMILQEMFKNYPTKVDNK